MLREYRELPRSVRILCVGSLINRAGSFVIIFLTIYASEELGYGVGFASACLGVFGLGSMCGSILGGQAADRIGRRPVMLLSLFGGAATLMAVGNATDRWAFMASVGCFALVTDMYRPAASAMVADVVSANRRPHAFALLYISMNLGFALAPPLGGLLAGISYQLLFYADALSMCLFGTIILLTIPESLGRKPMASNEASITTQRALAVLVADRTFLLFCAATFLVAMVLMQCMSTLPIFLRQSGLSHLEFGLLMSINGIMIFLFQLPVTHWLSRFSAMKIMTVGGMLIGIGFGLCAIPSGMISGGMGFFALTVLVWTLGEILQAPFYQAIVTDLAPQRLRASYLGVFGLSFSLALTIGAPLGGWILRTQGATTLWLGAFSIAMVAAGLFAALVAPVTARLNQTDRLESGVHDGGFGHPSPLAESEPAPLVSTR
jgi:MFS family permease